MGIVRLILLIVAAGLLLISLLLLAFSVLGFLGIAADIGPQENLAIGYHALGYGLGFLLLGLVLAALATWVTSGRRNEES